MFNVLFVDQWMTFTDADTGEVYEEARGAGECVAVVDDIIEGVAILQEAPCPVGWEGVITDCHHRRVPQHFVDCAAAVLLAHRDQQEAHQRDTQPTFIIG